MKRLILFALLVWARPAVADDDWKLHHTLLEATFEALIIVDWHQTATISGALSELNPILGHQPSRSAVAELMLAELLLHPLVSILLPEPWRTIWQGVSLGWEASTVYYNFRAGWGFRW